jgi:pilus assembly protein Flp/PilA
LGKNEAAMNSSKFFKRLLHDIRGTSAVEYGLILSLIVLAVVAAITGVANETLKMWTDVEAKAAKAHSGGN